MSQWADQNRRLSPESSAEPGRWNTDRAPYQRGIHDAVTDSLTQDIVVMSSSQVGKTEILLNTIGYYIDLDPSPMLLVQPTLDLAEAFSKDRLAPMVRDTPCLQNKVKDARARDSGNTLLHKKFAGGHITMAGANSPASLASRPIRIILCDEIDRYPASAGTEGDPVNLAKKRSTTFFNKKHLLVSTPTTKNQSRIEAAYEASDKRKYHIPCPHCGFMQVLSFSNLKWEGEKPTSVLYECADCRKSFDDSDKLELLKKGEWIAENEFDGTAGFWINELYSPWVKWAQIVKDFIEAKKSVETLKTWVNTSLGETWEEKGDKPDWKRLYECRETYPVGKVPNGALILTAGVDVQKDRIEVQIIGWGKGKESWSIDHRVFMGDTSTLESDSWKKLACVLEESFQTSYESDLIVSMMAVDSGYNTQNVYNWVRNYPRTRVMAIKGRDSAGIILSNPTAVDRKKDGKRVRRGIKVWMVGTNVAKSELYGWLKLEKPIEGEAYPPGYCHHPEYEPEYFEQLTAEKLVRKKLKNGYFGYVWEKTRERNEALDTRIYARAAAAALGIDRYADIHWTNLGIELGIARAQSKSEEKEKPIEKKIEQPKAKIARRKSSFL